MSFKGGYIGRILRVNLNSGSTSIEPLNGEVAEKFIGGSGYAAWIIYRETPMDIDPLDPSNKLVFMTGPLTGTITPSAGRYVVCALSPLTGIWAESHAAGYWGPELKFAGFDGVIVEGRSEKSVYLWIHESGCEIRDAKHLWGLDTYSCEDALKKELGLDIRVASIGPAGENLVKYANIINDRGRAAGRCGLGAVMGSKNLKAIAVKGSVKLIPAAEEDKLASYVKKLYVTIRSHPTVQIYSSYGTDGIMSMMYEYGDVPIKHFTEGVWSGIENISGEVMAKKVLKRNWACFRCPIACGRIVEVKDGSYKMEEGMGPEYETVASLGALCLNDDIEAIVKANELCNKYGVDTITTGVSIAFLMECCDRGLISREVNGLRIEWGNPNLILKLIRKIAFREGIGAFLAEGVRKMSETMGEEAKQIAMHVKGLEVPMHDPRAFKGMGLQYATSHRGACHLRGEVFIIEQGERIPDLGIHERVYRFDLETKPRVVKIMQDWHDVLDSLILCKFAFIPPAAVAAILSMVVGRHITVKELTEVGERIYNLKRIIDVKRGVTAKDDSLPYRLLKEPLKNGGAAGQVVELEKMLSKYYELRGWDGDGVPSRERLIQLGLKGVAEEDLEF
ncbi:aldehyde ferredoxin oxidoreductase family protein [Candidatus Bathyarchaeota archaeon]|nr:aldehyde ferredoxin oxidoreductase family protein [Candidatus Bathyarchaeota archaeon]MBS7617731.1 aldehyde ferredoxin oxidoreductase family protein [Candidatus Bathyarchaeota archaeon]